MCRGYDGGDDGGRVLIKWYTPTHKEDLYLAGLCDLSADELVDMSVALLRNRGFKTELIDLINKHRFVEKLKGN